MSRLLPSPPDLSLGDRDPRVVGVEDEDADELIAALSSETARNALTALHDQPATTSELADELDTSLQNVQYHLGNLREADLVEVVDTVYSEKGREMSVYAPADEPLVLFAGRSTDSGGLKTALKRLLGGYGILGLAALAAQSVLSVTVPRGEAGADGYDVRSTDGGAESADAGSGGDDAGISAEETPAMTEEASTAGDGGTFEVVFDGSAAERAELAAEHAVSLLEPGIVFFLGAALVFTLAWAYWYRRDLPRAP
ncbi:ArsR/SmtB family transcription factor [Haloparvum sedimenti]|uniref:ArsR/SmtB family transcription factor n=1 Tax=Haloparvum sedimenti TaxID=1678448 RepID=UPI00071E7C5F|nr:winged helix-turn-helix domain-containing protein [Haloparvum sedimenti]